MIKTGQRQITITKLTVYFKIFMSWTSYFVNKNVRCHIWSPLYPAFNHSSLISPSKTNVRICTISLHIVVENGGRKTWRRWKNQSFWHTHEQPISNLTMMGISSLPNLSFYAFHLSRPYVVYIYADDVAITMDQFCACRSHSYNFVYSKLNFIKL